MEAIIVALIGVVGSILVVLVEKGRKENLRDHGIVADKLEVIKDVIDNIDEDVAHIEIKLDNHLNDHKHDLSKLGELDLDDHLSLQDKNRKKERKYGSKK